MTTQHPPSQNAMEFATVTSFASWDFDDEVNVRLIAGWMLQGSPSVVYCGEEEDGCPRFHYMQSFIRIRPFVSDNDLARMRP